MDLDEATRLRIKKLMKENNLSGYKLALLCGIDASTINKLLNKSKKSLKLKTIALISQALNMDLKDFFDDDIFKDIEVKD